MYLSKRTQTDFVPGEKIQPEETRPPLAQCQHLLTVFDPEDPRHRQKLLEWSRKHWASLFEKAFLHRNSLFWHFCCSSVSKRRFMESAGHPTLHTQAVFRMPSFKAITSPEQLYQFLLDLLQQAVARGFKPFLPAINRLHVDLETSDTLVLQRQLADLRSQLEDKTSVFERIRIRAERLEEQNKKLISTARTWCQMYHSLLETREDQTPHPLSSPTKHKEINFVDLF